MFDEDESVRDFVAGAPLDQRLLQGPHFFIAKRLTWNPRIVETPEFH